MINDNRRCRGNQRLNILLLMMNLWLLMINHLLMLDELLVKERLLLNDMLLNHGLLLNQDGLRLRLLRATPETTENENANSNND
eukprot:GDKH01011886.1.p2 GENE.GDKH01011886.1~~GDKH01011886.1.p2  ORF type:complete len:84 (-),score=11.49 GDKH01011886.1:81-332(-)